MALVQEIIPLAVPQAQLSLGCARCQTLSWRKRLSLTTDDPFSLSVRCHWAGRASIRRHAAAGGGGPLSGRKVILEKLWREFFSDPSQWWDHRADKVCPRYPDFKHKKSQNALWLVDRSNPLWVDTELAAMPPGRLKLNKVFSWNIRLQRYVKAGDYKKTMELFQQLQQEGMDPNKFTFVPILNACAGLGVLEEGRRIHAQIIENGHEADVYVANCLVDMYAKCGSIADAQKVFNNMSLRDVVSWTAMILGYVKCGEGQKALEISRQMYAEGVEPDPATFVGLLNACASVAALEAGKLVHEQIIRRGYESDDFVASSLVDMYAKCGSIEDAQSVFNKMPTRNAVSWTAMLAGYAMHGRVTEALDHFERMRQEDVEMDGVTFVCLLLACNHGGLTKEGLYYFKSMIEVHNIYPTVEHYACIVDLLGRAGHLQKAEDLIRSMPCEPNATVWRSLLGACRIHGDLEIGERVAKQVLDLEPENGSAYVLLSNIYAGAGKGCRPRLERVEETSGCTWIAVNNKVHLFVSDDSKHPQIAEIHSELERLSLQMSEAGCVPETRSIEPQCFPPQVEAPNDSGETIPIASGRISTVPGSPLPAVRAHQWQRTILRDAAFIASGSSIGEHGRCAQPEPLQTHRTVVMQ